MNLLAAMRTFVAVVDQDGFAAAGRWLGVSKTKVSRVVSDLEAHLGLRLLHRTTRHHSLTEEGTLYLERCRAILDDVDRAAAEIGERAVTARGRLKISAPLSFGVRFIAPLVPRFMTAHPDIQVDLILNDGFVDLVEDGFDMAVRVGGTSPPTLIRRKLGEVRTGLYATPAYLATRGRPKTADDLKTHDCLVYGGPGWARPWWFDGRPVTPPARLLSNNGDVLRAAALDDLGLVSQPDFLIADDVRDGRLVTLEMEPEHLAAPIAALYPERRHAPQKVRVFIDFLIENLTCPKG